MTNLHTTGRHDPPNRGELRQARLARGWSQSQLARAVGVDVQTIGRWESGKSIPRQRYFAGLCEGLRIDAFELARILGSNVVSLPAVRPPGERPIAPSDSVIADLQTDFFRAALSALERGDASSEEWRRSAQTIARALNVPWTDDGRWQGR